MPPDKAEIKSVTPGPVFWITGLSGSGKSTLARLLAAQIRISGGTCVLLDGDELRELWPGQAGFTRPERVELGLKYGRLCRMISCNGICVVIATIALYREVHQWLENNVPELRIIWMDVSLAELRRRDPKGIYSRYDAGEISNVAGLDLAVDWPRNPWFQVRWHTELMPEQTLAQFWPSVAGLLHLPIPSSPPASGSLG